MSRIAAGRLTGVFGIRGELKCRPLDDAAFVPGARFSVATHAGARDLVCAGARRHHARLLVAFDGIATPEDARPLVGCDLYADGPEPVLGADEYLDADLVGLRLVDAGGSELARVVGIRHYPAQDCLVVDPGGALVPLVKAFIRAVDVAAGTIVVELPDGLL